MLKLSDGLLDYFGVQALMFQKLYSSCYKLPLVLTETFGKTV